MKVPSKWNCDSNLEQKLIKKLNLSGQQLAEFKEHQGWVRSMCFSPNRKRFATARSDGTTKIWNLSGQQLAEFNGYPDWIRSVRASPEEPPKLLHL